MSCPFIAFYKLKFKHSLNNSVIKDILRLIKILLPKPNKVPNSSNKLTKALKNNNKYQIFSVCSKCKNLELIPSTKFSSKYCNKCKKNEQSIPFVTFDIVPQLEIILNNQDYVQQIKQSQTASSLNSALSGSLYKKFLASNDKERDLIISFNLNSDGAPVCHSKNFSLWPVFGSISELNKSCREKFENL
jgi:hypothetical protein